MTTWRSELSALSFVLGLAMLIGCSKRDPELTVDMLAGSLQDVNLETEADVQAAVSNAAGAPRAIIFVHVDWAIMEPQRTVFAEFMLEYQRKNPDHSILFHYVDCTPVTSGYRPLTLLPGWLELQEAAGTSLIHGWGEIVWMAHGQVLHVERILNFDSAAELIAKTESLMLTSDDG
jgi:hypothetical protein